MKIGSHPCWISLAVFSGVAWTAAELPLHHRFDQSSNLGQNHGSAVIPWSAFSGITHSTNRKFGGGSASFVRGTSQALTGSLAGMGARTNSFTLSLFVHANTGLAELNNWPDFLSVVTDAGFARFVIEATGPGGGIALYRFRSGASTDTDAQSLGRINSNTWHHLGIVGDGSYITLYVDGVASGEPIAQNSSETITALTLASRYGSTTRGITALLDELAFFPEALSPRQMAWLAWNPPQAAVPAFTSYQDWAKQIPHSARRGSWVDHDGDGTTNLAEYCFGTSPLEPGEAHLSTTHNAQNRIMLRWFQLESGTDYVWEHSHGLMGDWLLATDVTSSLDPERTPPAGYLPMRAELPADAPKRFFRIRATPVTGAPGPPTANEIPPLPVNAQLALDENWHNGSIDMNRWYLPRKMWGQGNNGVTPDNVRVETDNVWGRTKHTLVCQANGDLYDGPVTGYGGAKTRVGGMIVSRAFFASGRYEVVMKIGGSEAVPGGPADPMRPAGSVPAVWTYGYRYVSLPSDLNPDLFHAQHPLYNPHMKVYGRANEYWTEIDFPEFGAQGNFDIGLYNTWLQGRQGAERFNVATAIDGDYHTLTTDWHTGLVPIPGLRDSQVVEHLGFHWIHDKAVPFQSYYGNPVRKLGADQYAVLSGTRAVHYLDGRKVGENVLYTPSMAAQLTFGVWLPGWGGPAPWKLSKASFASARIWTYQQEGDVHGVVISNITDNF